MKMFPLSLFAAVLAAVAPNARAQDWKAAGSETLTAPAEGIALHVRTLDKTGPAPTSNGNGTATPPQATLNFVSFEVPRYTFAVYDQGINGRENLGEAMEHHGALAGVNGGYFSPDFEPVGLLLTEGRMETQTLARQAAQRRAGGHGQPPQNLPLDRAAARQGTPARPCNAGRFWSRAARPSRVSTTSAARGARRCSTRANTVGGW